MTREEEIQFIIGVREGVIPFEEMLKQYKSFIWQYVNRYKIAGLTYEDIYSILCGELYIALLNYDEAKNIRFMTYLGTCFTNKLSVEIEYSKRKKHGAEGYERASRLDKIYPCQFGNENVTYRDILLKGDYANEQIDINYFYDCFYEILEKEGGDFKQFIIDVLINERTFKEIADERGRTSSAIGQRYNKYIGILKKRLIQKGVTSVYMK